MSVKNHQPPRPKLSATKRLSLLVIVVLILGTGIQSFAQSTIRGTVRDRDNLPIPSVSIFIKGTTRGTTSGDDGKYTIQASENEVLVFSAVSYVSTEIRVGTADLLNVTLEREITNSAEDVVVIGYGRVKKKDLTGTVGIVDMKDVNKAPVASFAEALAGRVAGVQVTSTDGQPGAGYNITIRGPGSLTQNTAPLYVIDGIPTENVEPATLNMEEIESMTILKDASATAIYGSRAANGVILIQTKRGRQSRPVVDFTTQYAHQTAPPKMELMSPYEFAQYQMELHPTRVSTLALFQDGKTLEDYRNIPGVDMQDYLFRAGQMQTYNLSLRGGNEATRYSLSGGYVDQIGTIINTGYRRYSGRATLDQTISKVFSAGATINLSDVLQSGQTVNVGQAAQNNPTSYILTSAWLYRPVATREGQNLIADVADADMITPSDLRINPYISQQNQYSMNKTKLIEANAYVNVNFSDKLVFRSVAGIRRNQFTRENFYNSKTAQGSPLNPNNQNGIFGTVATTQTDVFTNTNTLTYNTVLGEKHSLNGLALFEVSTQKLRGDGFTGRLLPNESLGISGIDQGEALNPILSTSNNAVASYATRWDYNYDSRYLLTATFRADGSSKFINNKWGYFPSVAAAWNMHNEGFLKNGNSPISTSKLKIGYGTTGNNRIADFAAFASLVYNVQTQGYAYNNNPGTGGAYVNNVGNTDLRWETIKTLDIGYELGLFNDRALLEVGLYRRITSDLLLSAPLPPSSGFGSGVKNIGELKNEGLEISLNTINIQTSDFRWQTGFNISFNRNMIMALADGQNSIQSTVAYVSQFGQPLYLAQIGQPAGMMIGYVWEGNYQYEDFDNPAPGVYLLRPDIAGNGAVRNTIQPGDIRYRDINGDGNITDADLTFIGRGQPRHIGGLTNNFRYKNFDLNVFFQWSYGNNIYNANRLLLEGNSNNYVSINQFKSYTNRWTPENQTNANYRAGGQGPIGFHSSRVVEDGSFLRLKTVNLSYSFPTRITEKLSMSGLSIYVSAQNLITWTNYTGLDPEVSVRSNVSSNFNGGVLTPGYDYSAYPKSPLFAFGIRGNF